MKKANISYICHFLIDFRQNTCEIPFSSVLAMLWDIMCDIRTGGFH